MSGIVSKARDGAGRRWRQAKERHYWLRHLVAAWGRFQSNNGGQYAAALTYFSFLALFPLILLGVSIVGFVLAGNAKREQDLFDKISSGLPGGFGDTVKQSVQTAIDHRTSVGIIALAGILLTGLGWVANLRAATNAVWGVQRPKRNIVMTKLLDLGVLVGLGVGVLVSVGLTTVGTALAGRILDAVDVHFVGAGTLAAVIGIALAIAGDVLIFGWLIVRLPRVTAPFGVVLRGALLAAIGFEVLKLIGTAYIANVTKSPTAGPFGSVVGILVWVYLVARYLLFCTAWTATAVAAPVSPAASEAALAELVGTSNGARGAGRPTPGISPSAVASSLVGAGFAVGAAATAWIGHRLRRN